MQRQKALHRQMQRQKAQLILTLALHHAMQKLDVAHRTALSTAPRSLSQICVPRLATGLPSSL